MEDLLDTFVGTLENGGKEELWSLLNCSLELLPFLLECSSQQEVYLVHRVCCHDYADVVYLLIHNGGDLNELDSEELTPLQVACKYGAKSVVCLLLHIEGCDLDRYTFSSPTSPLYLATINGHISVVEELVNFVEAECKSIKEKIYEGEVLSLLFYAACLSGTLEMVEFWFRFKPDVNSPVQMVTQLTNCENLTPLQAACEADCMEIIMFLLEKGARIQAAIVDNYPDTVLAGLKDGIITDQVLYRKGGQDGRFGASEIKVMLSLERRLLYKLHPAWFEPHVHCLARVDVSHNCLKVLPSCLPWQLPKLEYLNVSNNNLHEFPAAPKNSNLDSLGISEMNLSKNKLLQLPQDIFKLPSLKKLDVHHNFIQFLYRSTNTDYELMSPSERHKHFKAKQTESGNPATQICRSWKCSNLSVLNVSHNDLELLSDDLLAACTSLTKLIANNNKLHKFPSPWACELTFLDLCHNGVFTVPTSVAQFWSTSLRTLLLSHNSLTELPESIVALNVLEALDLSHNAISHLASPSVWACDYLQELNLGYNCLSNSPQESPQSPRSPKVLSFLRNPQFDRNQVLDEKSPTLEFPSILKDHLCYLYLNNNNLRSVPTSVFELKKLKILNLKCNPNLTSVPNELAKLKDCDMLDLEGCSIPASVIPPKLIAEASYKAGGLLAFLRLKLRECDKCNRLKLMVLGKERRGKTALVNALMGTHDSSGKNPNQIVIREWKLAHSSSWWRRRDMPVVTFSVWDFPGASQLSDIHQCFFTENTLYLLVWDAQDGIEGVKDLDKWFRNIQSHAASCTVLIVATHLDHLHEEDNQLATYIGEMTEAIRGRYGRRRCPRLGPIHYVCCLPGVPVGITELQEAIYATALSLKNQDSRGFVTEDLIGRQMPKSYQCLQQLLQKEAKRRHETMEPPVLVQNEFDDIIKQIPNHDLDTDEEMTLAVRFLHELGDLLHFNDQLKGLNSLYFLDPVWLCNLLSQVVVSEKAQKYIHNGIIQREDMKYLFDESRFPHVHMDKYIQLLERFEITLMLDEEKLLIPSKVSQEKFGSVQLSHNLGEKIYRFYKMEFIPSGFMSRLISKVLGSIPRFTGPTWRVTQESGSRVKNLASMNRGSFQQSFCKRSGKGFRLKHVEPIYWQEGIKVSHEGGQFMVEAIKWSSQDPDQSSQSNTGILITVLSAIGDFSALGFLVDEIDNLIEDWYRGLEEGIQFALCPDCCGDIFDLAQVNHFSVVTCAGVCRTNDSITCPITHNKIPLKKLVPELILADLPRRFLIDGKDLEITVGKDSLLGEGSFGCVYSGSYREDTVAVKVFPVSLFELIRAPSDAGPDVARETSGTWHGENCDKMDEGLAGGTNDSGAESIMSSLGSSSQVSNQSYLSHGSSNTTDLLESKGLKVYYSLSEMRKEVAMLSKLIHPCVLSLVGICLFPTCLVLERAPLGNLREAITEHMDPYLHDNVISKIKNKVFPSVFSRKLTYKIIFQITKALNYLHSLDVIYRDLKPANVLVWSMDTADTVNIKLSDYSISQFSTPQGLAGFCGTPGYQAPEVCFGVAYDDKVDIFSFGIVVYEILTGVIPYRNEPARCVTKAVRDGVRPRLQAKDYSFDTRMPFFEALMEKCWQQDPMSRPNTTAILTQMKDSAFLCLEKEIHKSTDQKHGSLDCIFLYCSEVKNCDLAWLWEGWGTCRKYHIVDVSHGQYVVPSEPAAGPQVTCATKVNDYIWVGNKSSQIEVFGQKGAGVPTCLGKIDTPASPTCLLYHRVADPDHKLPCQTPRPLQAYVDYVYCGLEDARLVVFSSYEQNPLLRQKVSKELRWSPIKTLRFAHDKPVTKAIQLNNDTELWLACGSAVVVVGLSTLLVEHTISAVLPETEWDTTVTIADMAFSGNRVWCCCQNSCKVLEIDPIQKLPLFVFSCKDAAVYDNISSPISSIKSPKDDVESKEQSADGICQSVPSSSAGGDTSQFKNPEPSDSALSKTEDSSPPPVLPRKPALPPRHLTMIDSQGIQRKVIKTRPTSFAASMVTPPSDEMVAADAPDIPPRVPSRSSKPVLLRGPNKKSFTLPRTVENSSGSAHGSLSRKVSRSMVEKSSDNFSKEPLSNTCLLVVKDTLWIGQNNGNIIAVSTYPVSDHGKVMFLINHSSETAENIPRRMVTMDHTSNNSVLSTHKLADNRTGLLLWEAWGAEEVEETRGYAIKLHKLENELSRMSSI
ncbi:leucine-rich repeat serine/threonine-protein kinase 1-like [Liolophura sinensis]|uniref:leucine-rich repeat serine/threonine-protein kinase 1-like n=1 Tax=Liolophura sinensis TaxID=3198878 RepID=UPI0031587F28